MPTARRLVLLPRRLGAGPEAVAVVEVGLHGVGADAERLLALVTQRDLARVRRRRRRREALAEDTLAVAVLAVALPGDDEVAAPIRGHGGAVLGGRRVAVDLELA